MAPRPFIVAEVSKTWINGQSADPRLIAELFEQVLEHNRQRGYLLHSFALHQMMVAVDEMTETIIAVFERLEHTGMPESPTREVIHERNQ